MALCKVVYVARANYQSGEDLARFETSVRAKGVVHAGKKTEKQAIAYFQSVLGDTYWIKHKTCAWSERVITPLESFNNR